MSGFKKKNSVGDLNSTHGRQFREQGPSEKPDDTTLEDLTDDDDIARHNMPAPAVYLEATGNGARRSISVPNNQELLIGFNQERVRSAHKIKILEAGKEDKTRRSISVPNNKELLIGVNQERVRSAYKIKILEAGKEDKTKEVEQNTHIFKGFEALFKGTELQVLYRVNMLINQHENLDTVKENLKENLGLLHHAVCKKFTTVAEKVLESGASFLDLDNKKNTPLHYALGCQEIDEKEEEYTKEKTKCDEVASLLISKMKPFRVRQFFGDKTEWPEEPKHQDGDLSADLNGQTNTGKRNDNDIFELLGIKRPSLLAIMKDKDLQETARTILDKLEDTYPGSKDSYVYVHLLLGNQKSNETTNTECAFHYIVKHRTALINHPVCRAVIKHKWNQWAFCSYLIDTVIWFLSFVALTICTVVGAQSDHVFIYNSPWQYTRGALEILMCIFILRSLYTECLQFMIDPKDYVKSIMNWIELGSAVLLIIEISLRYAEENAHWFVFAVGYILWTIKGVKYASVTSHTSAYSETLRTIMIRDFWLFALFFTAIEMVFGGTFLLVLKGTDSLEIEAQTTTIIGIYYVGLRTMIEGDMPIDYNQFPRVAIFVILVFMSLTIVVMLNILIAQLSNTYEAAYAEGQIKSWVNRADTIVNFEKEDNFKDKYFRALCHCPLLHFVFYKTREPKCEEKLKFDKEELLEEKEKTIEMRTTLKQLDSKLIHADLTIQTIKTRQNAMLRSLQDKSVGCSNTVDGYCNNSIQFV